MTEQTDPIEQNNSASPRTGGEELFMLFRGVLKHMARLHHHGHGHGPGRHAQRHVLAILRERGSLNQRELMGMLNVRSASLSELLGKLERHGLVRRERDEQDRRNFVISPTEAGNMAFSEHESERREQAEQVFAALDAEERASLAGLLEKLARSLEADESARGCHAEDGEHGHGPHGHWKSGHHGHPEGRERHGHYHHHERHREGHGLHGQHERHEGHEGHGRHEQSERLRGHGRRDLG